MDSLDLAGPNEDPVAHLAGEVGDALDGAVVLAVLLVQLYAYPFAGGVERRRALEAHDAAPGGNGDDGAQGGVHYGGHGGVRATCRKETFQGRRVTSSWGMRPCLSVTFYSNQYLLHRGPALLTVCFYNRLSYGVNLVHISGLFSPHALQIQPRPQTN